MRRLVSLSLAIFTSLMAVTSASAADPTVKGPVRIQFWTFDPQTFEAGARGPSFELLRGHESARFARMLELKKDLMPGIGAARKDPVFK